MERQRTLKKLRTEYPLEVKAHNLHRDHETGLPYGKGLVTVRFNGVCFSEPANIFPSEATLAKIDLVIYTGALTHRRISREDGPVGPVGPVGPPGISGHIPETWANKLAENIRKEVDGSIIDAILHGQAVVKVRT